ncbi:MAG: pyruvate flavodoxin/ferredoxin oxidoreductase [Chloroflexi bacterium]|nr:pyruvate flavodoxin/ferredoxin oxidoreductase [Chloroflexota bacterium]
MYEFIDGAELIARGAIDIGCDFFAGYPITPASPILIHMLRELPKVGGVGIQAEDEIASISMTIGAAMTGARAMTATAGPGISLYSENIGLALMGEVPLVIVDVQRLGPATGGATTVAQGDVQFLRWSTSGGYPVIALCPSDAAECYTLTQHAFNLAERFRTPVFLATDKETVMTQGTLDTDAALKHLTPERRTRTVAAPGSFLPYPLTEPATAPPFAAIGDAQNIVRFTTSTHDERGMLTKKPEKVERLNNHLYEKIRAHAAEIEMVRYDPQDGAETLVVSFGITARSMQEAVADARADGQRVSQLIVQSLWPVPENALRRALAAHRRIVVPELNHGQYRLEIERIAYALDPRPAVSGVNRVDGELIAPRQIQDAL